MNPDRKPRELPLGEGLGLTIDRLHQIAAASQDALISEGPVNPDYELLDVCAEALHLVLTANKLWQRRDEIPINRERPAGSLETNCDLRTDVVRQAWKLECAASRLMRRAKKLKATTPAGVYSKALLVRASVAGAGHLGMSLATDMIACEGLRASLWPAGEAR